MTQSRARFALQSMTDAETLNYARHLPNCMYYVIMDLEDEVTDPIIKDKLHDLAKRKCHLDECND